MESILSEVIFCMKVRSYSELTVWQRAMDMVEDIYNLTRYFPKEELYSLTNQMRRAAVSIPSCIAEGHDRFTGKEYKYFLRMAQGSRAEVETQVILANRLGYINKIQRDIIMEKCCEISKMLYSLMKKIQ